jgi:target of rapamycin complex 2 subunit MAPKAP1
MYMQEALETVCRKRRLQPKEYALLLSDMSILIPLDRTVASLQGESDLRLVKRSMLPHMNVDVRPIGRSTDPNGTSFPSLAPPFFMPVLLQHTQTHTEMITDFLKKK